MMHDDEKTWSDIAVLMMIFQYYYLLEDQAPSAESLAAPSHSKMICLKWIPISETVKKGTESKVIHLFLHGCNNWMDIMLVHHLLVEHPFAAGFGQTCKAWRALADSLGNCKSDQIQQQMDAQPIDAASAWCPSNYFVMKE